MKMPIKHIFEPNATLYAFNPPSWRLPSVRENEGAMVFVLEDRLCRSEKTIHDKDRHLHAQHETIVALKNKFVGLRQTTLCKKD